MLRSSRNGVVSCWRRRHVATVSLIVVMLILVVLCLLSLGTRATVHSVGARIRHGPCAAPRDVAIGLPVVAHAFSRTSAQVLGYVPHPRRRTSRGRCASHSEGAPAFFRSRPHILRESCASPSEGMQAYSNPRRRITRSRRANPCGGAQAPSMSQSVWQ